MGEKKILYRAYIKFGKIKCYDHANLIAKNLMIVCYLYSYQR